MWRMKPAKWIVDLDAKIYKGANDYITDAQEFGMKYHTKELAEKARDEMKEANLLRYWVSVIDPEWEADWEDIGQEKYYIDFDIREKEYLIFTSNAYKTLGTVYMSEEAAIKIVEALNNGELVL